MPFTSAATFSAFSLLWSSTPILAPLAAMARAVAAPRPEPPPVMTTATSFNCMVGYLLERFFPKLERLFLKANSEWRIGEKNLSSFHSLFAMRHSLREHTTTDQCLHVADILTA